MRNDTDSLSVIYKPRSGPRRRIRFARDERLGEVAYAFWRIEEVYSTTTGQWREVGREHVADIRLEETPVRPNIDVEPRVDASNAELVEAARTDLTRAIDLSYDGHPSDARTAMREAAQRLQALFHPDTAEVIVE